MQLSVRVARRDDEIRWNEFLEATFIEVRYRIGLSSEP